MFSVWYWGIKTKRYFGEEKDTFGWAEVNILGGSCFCDSKIERVAFETESQLTRIGPEYFYKCSLWSSSIPQLVDILTDSCFTSYSPETVVLDSHSGLTRIENDYFCDAQLKEIHV
jgi:hypothetical protein